MSAAYEWPLQTLARLLLSVRDVDPSLRVASYLLARDAFDVDNTQPRDPTVGLLGGDRHDNVLQPVHTDVGNLEYCRATVTSEYKHLRRHVEAAIQTKMGLECRAS